MGAWTIVGLLALAALAAIAVCWLLRLSAKVLRPARIPSGIAALCVAAILYGGDKSTPRGVPPPRSAPVVVRPADAEKSISNWNAHGAWRKSFWFPFDGDWVFPDGTNRLHGVEIISQGRLWRTPFDTNAVADAGIPLAIVPGLTAFAAEHTPSNSYRFVWTDAAARRDTNELVTASVELFRNGDIAVETNGVATLLPCELPYAHDGFGQDEEWVQANFTNAEEVLETGYAQWVDAQVGHNLTNGLYKLTATLLEDPPETIRLSVGGRSIAVTNAGEYAFLLEKGTRYPITVFPRDATNFQYGACDDVGPQMRGAQSESRRAAGSRRAAMPRLGWTPSSALCLTAHVDDAGLIIVCPAANDGYVVYRPQLTIMPDYVYNPPLPMMFIADVYDAPEGMHFSFDWECGDRQEIGPCFTWDDNEGLNAASLTATCGDIVLHGSVSAVRDIQESSIALEGEACSSPRKRT